MNIHELTHNQSACRANRWYTITESTFLANVRMRIVDEEDLTDAEIFDLHTGNLEDRLECAIQVAVDSEHPIAIVFADFFFSCHYALIDVDILETWDEQTVFQVCEESFPECDISWSTQVLPRDWRDRRIQRNYCCFGRKYRQNFTSTSAIQRISLCWREYPP